MLRHSVAVLLLAVLPIACQRSEMPPVAAPPPSGVEAEAVSGSYHVRGITVQALTGRQRDIEGTIKLDVEETRYEVSFELATTAPDFAEPVAVRVRGMGRGFIVGGIFTGTTEEWMALDRPLEESLGVPLPANAGRKIVSSSQASFSDDGVFQILLQNHAVSGEHYAPSVTVLAGRRVVPSP